MINENLLLLCLLFLALFLIGLIIKAQFNKIIFISILSLISVIIYLLLDAPDVAMTEASVGIVTSILLIIGYYQINLRQVCSKITINWQNLLLCLALGFIILIGFSDIPKFGDAAFGNKYNAIFKHDFQIESRVSAILAGYRAYDTLLETMVIYLAAIGISTILKQDLDFNYQNQDIILQNTAKIILPFIILFGIYILFQGEHAVGGGFQAGVILACASLIFACIKPINFNIRKLNYYLIMISSSGLLLYFLVGFAGLINQKSIFNYELFVKPAFAIMLVEFAVCITVFASVTNILISFLTLKVNCND